MEATAQSQLPGRRLILVPAYNEEASLGSLLDEVRALYPETDVLVVSDGSVDGTARLAAARGAIVLDLPCNLGVGGAVQAGFRYAWDHGYDRVIRLDGDGQHPPSEIPRLEAGLAEGGADLIVGSRFLDRSSYASTAVRRLGIRALALFLSVICRRRVTDPTSGFWLVNRPLLRYFAFDYPSDYPEPEALALLRRQGYDFREVPALFRPRHAGESSIHAWDAVYYALKVGLALVIDRIRPMDLRFARNAPEAPS